MLEVDGEQLTLGAGAGASKLQVISPSLLRSLVCCDSRYFFMDSKESGTWKGLAFPLFCDKHTLMLDSLPL